MSVGGKSHLICETSIDVQDRSAAIGDYIYGGQDSYSKKIGTMGKGLSILHW